MQVQRAAGAGAGQRQRQRRRRRSSMFGNFAKKGTAKWVEGAKIFLFIGFPIAFTILQAQRGVMGYVVTDREYVRFPPESEQTSEDMARIKRTARIIKQVAAEEKAAEESEEAAAGGEKRGLRSLV